VANKPVAAGPGGDDRREGHPVDEEGAEHLAALRELPEQQAPDIGRAVPELVRQPLPIRRAASDGLAHVREVCLQGDPTRLLSAERVEHRVRCGVRLVALGNRLGEPLLAGADETELVFQRQPALGPVPVSRLEAPERLRDGGVHHRGIEPGGHALEDGRLEYGLREMKVV
jgi:hypothetical protein